MITSHAVKPFIRYGIKINESLWIGDKPYFTARAIGHWLGLSRPNRGVNQIVSRNPYILRFSKQIKVAVSEKHQRNDKTKGLNLRQFVPKSSTRDRDIEIRVFDPIGLQLIAMESRTKQAKEYKVAAAKLVWNFMNGMIKEITLNEQEKLEILSGNYIQQPLRKKSPIQEYAEKHGCSLRTASRHRAIINRGENPFDRKYKGGGRKIIVGDMELKIRKLYFVDHIFSAKEIYLKIGCPKSPSYKTVSRFVKKLKTEAGWDLKVRGVK